MSPRQATREKLDAGGKSRDGDGSGRKVKARQLEGEVAVALGDLIWVKLHRDSWWPAQVFDENSVSKSSKPGSRPAQAVLVRLYGSYEYLYVDPIKCHSEFEMVLEQNNGCSREMFEKALEQELLHLKSGRSKRKSSASTGRVQKEDRRAKKISRQGEIQKTVKPDSSTGEEDTEHRTPEKNEGTSLSRKAPELSERRRLRVMQSLGLIAPSGSPFGKSGKFCMST